MPERPWRTNMMPDGEGGYFLYLPTPLRAASSTRVGDRATLDLEFDRSYKSGPGTVPSWFAAALESSERAKHAWDSLSPSRQKEILSYLRRLKSGPAKERNLLRAIKALEGAKARYMAHSWKSEKSLPA